MRDAAVCYLISESFTKDSILQEVSTRTYNKVYCYVRSITRAEWSEASRNGLNPSLMLELFRYDYNGEELVNIGGVEVGGVVTGGETYAIYRTYSAYGDKIELYLEKRIGAA